MRNVNLNQFLQFCWTRHWCIRRLHSEEQSDGYSALSRTDHRQALMYAYGLVNFHRQIIPNCSFLIRSLTSQVQQFEREREKSVFHSQGEYNKSNYAHTSGHQNHPSVSQWMHKALQSEESDSSEWMKLGDLWNLSPDSPWALDRGAVLMARNF